MLFPEAAKRGIALIAVAVAAPLQAGMWVTGDEAGLTSQEDFGVRLLDTALAAPVLPAPMTATEQRSQVAEPSTGSATPFYAERLLDARLERAPSTVENTLTASRSLIRRGEAGALPTAGRDLAGLGWQAF